MKKATNFQKNKNNGNFKKYNVLFKIDYNKIPLNLF